MSWLTSFLVGYALLVAIMFVAQRSLMYPAGSGRPDLQMVEMEGLREIVHQTADGLSLVHWYRPARDPEKPVVVVFHGNAGHIGHRAGKYSGFVDQGFGLFLVGYRGYGGNPGKPTEEGLMLDARSALAWLKGEGIAAADTMLYGESLGTAVAVALAAEQKDIQAVMLEAPPASIVETAQARYWYLPAKWLVLDRWDSIGRIGTVTAPLLIVHGGADRVVPQRFGRKLFEAANEPKKGLFPAPHDHNSIWGDPDLIREILDFAESHRRKG